MIDLETSKPANTQQLPVPETVEKDKIMWGYLSVILLFHLLLPLAFVPWLFSWTGLILIPVGNFIFCSLGIGAGYHRLLTHSSQRFYRNLERGLNWVYVYIVHALLFLLAGFIIGWASTGEVMGGVQFGLSLLVYGVIFRTLFTWHITWGVNSASHLWGYRNFETKENSRNNWLFGLLTNGEGWHNNHHADPRCAAQGFYRWWEIDLTYLAIRGMKLLGLATDIVPRRVVKSYTSRG